MVLRTNTSTAIPQASKKRESRTRTPEGIRGLPDDLKKALTEESSAFGYENEWRCLLYAASLGLIVMRKMRDKAQEIINNLEHFGTTGR